VSKGRKINRANPMPIAPRTGTGDGSLKFENENDNDNEHDWTQPDKLEDYVSVKERSAGKRLPFLPSFCEICG
jgi:hypothetical protein